MGTTSAAATTATKSVGEVRPPKIAKYMVTAKSELAESSGGTGPSWSRAHGATSADVTAAVKPAGKERPLGEATYRAATKFEIAEHAGEFPTSCWENIAGQSVCYGTVAERAKRSGRKCGPASRLQALQANDDWFREEATGEYLPESHPVDGRPLFRRVTPSAVRER